MSETPVTVRIRARGHAEIRGVHKKSLELTRARQITAKATCIIGVDAEYDPAELRQLRGPLELELRVGDLVDRLTAVASPFFQDGEGLVLRKSDQRHGRTFAYQASKGAIDLDRRLMERLADPAAVLEVTITAQAREDGAARGVLYVVSTPIGNEDDLAPRALRTLEAVDLIAAEDTRVTRGLLERHGISTPLISYHDFNEATRAKALVARLEAGERVALVSDAGTPGCSDPGYRLVADAVQAGIDVSPVPGASALLAVLVASGLPWDRFAFVGFLDRKRAARRAELTELAALPMALVLYESPHRVLETLEDLAEIMPDRAICAGRELTKQHEELLRGTAAEVLEALAGRSAVLGEFAIVVAPPAQQTRAAELSPEVEGLMKQLLEADVSVQTLSRALVQQFGQSRKHWYEYLLGLKQAEG